MGEDNTVSEDNAASTTLKMEEARPSETMS
jgi:hypothetical protein